MSIGRRSRRFVRCHRLVIYFIFLIRYDDDLKKMGYSIPEDRINDVLEYFGFKVMDSNGKVVHYLYLYRNI